MMVLIAHLCLQIAMMTVVSRLNETQNNPFLEVPMNSVESYHFAFCSVLFYLGKFKFFLCGATYSACLFQCHQLPWGSWSSKPGPIFSQFPFPNLEPQRTSCLQQLRRWFGECWDWHNWGQSQRSYQRHSSEEESNRYLIR